MKRPLQEEKEETVDYGDIDAYARGGVQGVEEFLKQGGLSKADYHSILYSEGTGMEEGQRMRDELLPTHADENIDLDEQLTDIQQKDGVNRLKMLSLMVLMYHHVTTGDGAASVFTREDPAEQDIRMHL